MNIVAIIGTKHKQGTVSRLSGEVLRGAEENGHSTELINLYDYHIEYCIGCWACARTGRCVLKDDFEAIFEKVSGADVIIIGSPCYWGGVTAIMKNFFDRHTGPAMYKPTGADRFRELSISGKLKTVLQEVKNFGAHPHLRGKKLVFVTAMTAFFPFSYLWGDLPATLKAMKIYCSKLNGRCAGRIVFTDTLFRFNPNKEARMMRKAYAVGSQL